MIFVTVGAQMPFDRLVGAVDDWAGRSGRDDVLAQIGPSRLRPRHLRVAGFMDPPRFRETVAAAQVVVAHAGMGTILTALELGTPVLVFPRRAALGETRNDHQVATAAHFAERGLVVAAMREDELPGALERVQHASAAGCIAPQASPELLERIRRFVEAA